MVKQIGCIVQARMSSRRLPGKVLKVLQDKSVLGHILTRLKRSKKIDKIIVATSTNSEDDLIVEECKKYKIECFRGELENVLSRYYHSARMYKITDIVRICADNTMLDWNIIDKQVEAYYNLNPEILKSGVSIPPGIGGEIFPYTKLEEAYLWAKEKYQLEHVTPYIYENSRNIVSFEIERDLSRYRFTLDTNEDWLLVQKIYEMLYTHKEDFDLFDVIKMMEQYPKLYEINKEIEQIQVIQLNKENKYVKV